MFCKSSVHPICTRQTTNVFLDVQLGAPGIATRSDRTLLGAPGLTKGNKKLLGAPTILSRYNPTRGDLGR